MIRGIIFDFDGVILDTETPVFRSWQEALERRGYKLSLATWAKYIGLSPDTFDPCSHLEGNLSGTDECELIHQERKQREAQLLRDQPMLPSVEAYITSATHLGLKLGIASSSSRDWVINHLARFGLETLFDCIRCSDDVTHAKPNPELYVSVLKGLGLQADEVIALEDSPNGILAAKQAKIFCVAIPNAMTQELPLDHADLILGSMADIPLEELLGKINRFLTVKAG